MEPEPKQYSNRKEPLTWNLFSRIREEEKPNFYMKPEEKRGEKNNRENKKKTVKQKLRRNSVC